MSVDQPLLTRVAAGDREASGECVERYGNLVWSLARRFTRNSSEAEDAVQEIFIELWSKAARFDETKAGETTFVAMIARRRLIDRFRKHKRQPEMAEIKETHESEGVDIETDLTTRDQAAQAEKLIDTLKPQQQQVIRMSVYDGLSHQSIADQLEIPLGTVKTQLRRGLLRVREAMIATNKRLAAGEVGR